MLKGLPKTVWMISLPITIILGIFLGVLLWQNTFATGIPLLYGWMYYPFLLLHLLSSHTDDATRTQEWLLYITCCYYPLATLMASACTYWLRSRWEKYQAFLFVMLLACISVLVCIPVRLIAPSLTVNGVLPFEISPFGITVFCAALASILMVWFHSSLSVLLGWGVGCLIPRCKKNLNINAEDKEGEEKAYAHLGPSKAQGSGLTIDHSAQVR